MSCSNTFCILPWIHAHVLPSGDVIPCCAVEVGNSVLGNVHKKPLKEIWNDDAFKEIRLKMLNGEPVDACRVCYSQESFGGNSLRLKSNIDFSHHMNLAKKTNLNGSLDEFKLRYYDVRFSNLCNLRCRMCCSDLSSSIASDVAKMEGLPNPKVLDIYSSKESFLNEFSSHVPFLEEIYFAGGEPLLMDAHYWALEELLRQGRSDIKIRYNTNFAVLGKGSYLATDYWKDFSKIEIGASLDDDGERAEYIRQGTKWEKILINREILRREAPGVIFNIASTVGLMNLLHYPKFLRNCIKENIITANGFYSNNLMSPTHFSSQVLPEKWKAIARDEYKLLLSEMENLGTANWVLQNLAAIQKHMDGNDNSKLLNLFFKETKRLDKFYGKEFMKVFTEYQGLEKYKTLF